MKATIVATDDQRLASNPENSVWVTANAGSGKTHVLIDRVIRLLLAGSDPQSIMCLTYTKAAAAEMSGRLFDKLSDWVSLDDAALRQALNNIGADIREANTLNVARQLFARAIETPGGLKIQTIHAFCEKVLHLFPVESGLAPGFRVMDDEQKTVLLEQALDETLHLAGDKTDTNVLKLFDDGQFSNRENFDAVAKMFLGGTAIFHEGLDEQWPLDTIAQLLRRAVGLQVAATTADMVAQFNRIDRNAYRDAGEALLRSGNTADRTATVANKLLAIAACENSDDLINAMEELYFIEKGTVVAALYVKPLQKSHPDLCAWLDQQYSTLPVLLEQLALQRNVDATVALIDMLRKVNTRFVDLKQQRGLYDFDDLILRMRDLVSNRQAAQWVLYKLDSGLSHILVDESQDTSPTQWQIIRSLADEFFAGDSVPRNRARTLFSVGDKKQSIYSFQGADTAVFKSAKEHFSDIAKGAVKPFEDVTLKLSYRSVEPVLQMVDTVFAPKTTASQGMGDDGDDRGHVATRKDVPGVVELWPLFHAMDDEEPENWRAAVDHQKRNAPRQRLARYVAETVKSWIGQRQLLSAVPPRAVAAKDILVLLQKRGPLFTALIAAFRQHGVMVAGADRLKLMKSLAVQDLLALLQVIILPDDDLSLACVLKSPLLPQPFNETQLFDLAHSRRTSLWAALQADQASAATAMLLTADVRFADDHGPYDVLARVLARSRKAMVERLGVEALDATDMLLDQALDYEAQEGRSIAGFVHWFSNRDTDIKRELDQEQDQVRIMTVHGAKGLEANIVIMPDAHEAAQHSDKTRLLQTPPLGERQIVWPFLTVPQRVKPQATANWKDATKEKDQHEKQRLLYVAMTRARDELYIGGIMPKRSTSLNEYSWYALIEQSLETADNKLDMRDVDAGHPEGLIRRFGAEQKWLATVATDQVIAPEELPMWLQTPLPAGPASDVSLFTGRDGAGSLVDQAAVQRGQAIHAFLERLSSSDSASVLAARAARLKLDPALAQRLAEFAVAPETAALFSPQAQAERRIMGYLPSGKKVDRRVDRLLISDDHIIVLDFKSERFPPAVVPSKYATQIAEYVAVLQGAYPDHTVHAAILWTETAELIWLEMP